jgi:regulator of protease activity HflC (stomatin/prohibitin superfamily)
MKADLLSYSRATSVSILGVALQLAMGLALLLLGLLGKDHAALSGGYLALLGLIPWISLVIVFDQHRRERVEHLEAESLAGAAARQASVFETGGEDLRVAAKRLAWMHTYLMPVVSVVLAAALMGLGFMRFVQARELLDVDRFTGGQNRGWALAVGLGLGVAGFVFARFVSGMAKQAVWQNLRGGAGPAVMAALMGQAMVLGQVVQIAGSDVVLRYLQVAIPAAMMLLGVEIIFALVLNVYRPRRAGETPRPAFDSRTLSFIASPDRIAQSIGGAINYQFGVEVTGTWAYQLIARAALMLAVVGTAVVWLLTVMEIIEPNERGLRIANGRLKEEVGPGLYFKLPWPFEVFDSTQTTALRRVDLMTLPPATDGPILWTNDHRTEEVYAIVQPTAKAPASPGGAADAAISDIALVAVEIPLVYSIENLKQWEEFGGEGAREELLKACARREVMRYLAGLREDDLLGSKRTEASAALRERVQKRLDELKAGVKVCSMNIEGVHPQREAAKGFEMVVENQQRGEGALELGRTDAIKTLTETAGSVDLARQIAKEIDQLSTMRDQGTTEQKIGEQEARIEALIMQAGGKAGSLIERAQAQRWQRHMAARGRTEAYAGQLSSYRAAPELYRADLYFQMLRDVWKDARVYLTPDNPWINFDLKDVETGANVLTSPDPTR